MSLEGLLLKSVGGFYYVECDDKIYECRARGKFRKDEISPFAGDTVQIEPVDEQKGTVVKILPRKNSIIRPPLANLDQLIIVTSVQDPAPNTFIIDKLIAIAEQKEITPILIITKTDLSNPDNLTEVYSKAGFEVICTSNIISDEQTTNRIKQLLKGKISAFTGNTGVGKSSLLNTIDTSLLLETAQISQKLGRGRHTTRQTELYKLECGGYIADTPGFSTVELEKYEVIFKDQLQYCFREFSQHIDKCKFTDCSHTVESGCAVLQAVGNGEISSSRHKSYVALYEQAKTMKEWDSRYKR
ncbi:MAG: ribosome small subunit-dependent GTPase A [Oscillospiraceae bacterium]|nr:ribosome small subunit-dependent GTPase A [Oscillospiraceae bacterium]